MEVKDCAYPSEHVALKSATGDECLHFARHRTRRAEGATWVTCDDLEPQCGGARRYAPNVAPKARRGHGGTVDAPPTRDGSWGAVRDGRYGRAPMSIPTSRRRRDVRTRRGRAAQAGQAPGTSRRTARLGDLPRISELCARRRRRRHVRQEGPLMSERRRYLYRNLRT